MDAYGATILGHDPDEISTIKAAADRGLGTTDFQSLQPVEQILS